MKKTIAFVPVWALYYIGDMTAKTFEYFDSTPLYMLYNWCMCKSGDMQDWSGLTRPWLKPENLEIERRWLIKKLPVNTQFDELLHIKQYYTNEGRFRKSFDGAEITYYHTVKKSISFGVNEEIEHKITQEQFEKAIICNTLHNGSTTKCMFKHRYKIKIDGLVYEFDGLLFDELHSTPSMWILEIELKDINERIDMPEFVKSLIVKEITGDKSYSNYSMSVNV